MSNRQHPTSHRVSFQQLSILTSLILVTTITASTLNTQQQSYDPSDLQASYAERFKENAYYSAQIDWFASADLPSLSKGSDAIVHGRVIQSVETPADLRTGSLPIQVFEVQVYSYLKNPQSITPESILVSQVVGEHGNPLIQPGDECVFFLGIWYNQALGENLVYSLGGDYTRYVVYGGRVYSVASLNPQNLTELSARGDVLHHFLARVRGVID